MKKIDFNSRLLVPHSEYDLRKDKRFLVPFLNGTKIGFANANGEIVIAPQFEYVLDDFFHEKSLVRVGESYLRAYPRRTTNPATYLYKRFGLIKSDGTFLLPIEYEGIILPKFSDAITLRSMTKGYAVIDFNGNFIIPFGMYDYIDGFDSGYARIKIGKTTNSLINSDALWGIVNDKGEMILQPIYSNIWNFFNKARSFTRVVAVDNTIYEFHFQDGALREDGFQANKDVEFQREMDDYLFLQEYCAETYEQYNGSYAQDIMGYSDQDIDDAFDGDPDAYWNID